MWKVPALQGLQEVLHVADKKRKEQQTQSHNTHSEQHLPNEYARLQITGQGTNLLPRRKATGQNFGQVSTILIKQKQNQNLFS